VSSGSSAGDHPNQSAATKIDLRTDTTSQVDAVIDIVPSTDLAPLVGQVVTIRGAIDNEKDAPRIRLANAWITFPESCRIAAAAGPAEVTGRLVLRQRARYYHSVNEGRDPRDVAQDYSSGWYPDEFALTP
jgi:hypothetical protein